MYDIFLSYSNQDRERLQPLFQCLKQQGWSVFWDHRTIEIGDQWGKKIDRAIRTCKCVVVVWSKTSVDSEWVVEEANIGKQREVLLPIRIDEVIFPVGFTMRQTGDFVHWDGDANDPQFARLAEKVRELVGQHDVGQAQRVVEVAAGQGRLVQEHSAEEKVCEEAEWQANAKQKQVKREQAAVEEKERKEAARQAKSSQNSPSKRFPLIPAILISAAVLGGGGYVWQSMSKSRLVEEQVMSSRHVVIRSGSYTIISDGTVTDTKTGLMWKQCSEGQSGDGCSGEAAKYKWDDAMSKFGSGVSFASYNDWRMPTKDELRTLVYCSNGIPQEVAWDHNCSDDDKSKGYQQPVVDLTAFPNTPAWRYWSSTEKDMSRSWAVGFDSGVDYWNNRNDDGRVRLVRSGDTGATTYQTRVCNLPDGGKAPVPTYYKVCPDGSEPELGPLLEIQ